MLAADEEPPGNNSNETSSAYGGGSHDGGRAAVVTSTILPGSAAPALAQPAIGGKASTLIHVPQANLTSLDPVWTTAMVTRNSAGMIFETLFGRDEQLNARPQMVAGFLTEDGRPALDHDLGRWSAVP